MLQRPEIGTQEHILLWLAGKPADKTFPWSNYFRCACAQYAAEFGLGQWDIAFLALWDGLHYGNSLNALARGIVRETGSVLVTWGDLHDAACKAWQS